MISPRKYWNGAAIVDHEVVDERKFVRKTWNCLSRQ